MYYYVKASIIHHNFSIKIRSHYSTFESQNDRFTFQHQKNDLSFFARKRWLSFWVQQFQAKMSVDFSYFSQMLCSQKLRLAKNCIGIFKIFKRNTQNEMFFDLFD